MEFRRKNYGEMFKAVELNRLFNGGQLDGLLRKFNTQLTMENLIACGGDVTVFKYMGKDNKKHVAKIVPKNIRFFDHFGDGNSAKDFKKCINRLDPYFLPVEEILYEDDNVFVYTQRKCKLIESKRITRKVVIDVLRLVQFMFVNDILLTDLAPHNLGIINKHVVVFDYHGLHRLTKNGELKRCDWWRRLARNLTRFITGLCCPHERPAYSLLMQNCDEKVIKKMNNDTSIPKCFTGLVQYLMVEENTASIEKICQYLEECITFIKNT